MAIYDVVLYPYARQACEIDVPDEISKDEVKDWIIENIKEKGKFGKVELDYHGTDIDCMRRD